MQCNLSDTIATKCASERGSLNFSAGPSFTEGSFHIDSQNFLIETY